MPLFSIIIPTFNALQPLQDTLASIRAQEFESVEIVVQDGNSTDGTREWVANQSDLQAASAPDGGIYDAMNRAIERASGRFLIFLGAGDTLEAGVLNEISAAIGTYRGDKPLLIYGDAWWQSRGARYGGRFGQWRLTRQNVCHQAMVFEAKLFGRLGLYDVRYSNSADWAWNIAAWGDAGVEKRYLPLQVARYQGGGQSETSEDTAFNADVLGLVQRHFSAPVRALYTLRRRAPQSLKNRWKGSAIATNQGAAWGTVSVVIPTYNRGAKVEATLDSALAQTRAPLEIIVVDDGSTDGTAQWIRARYGERVRVIEQANSGVARARNRGWRAARGEWIAFLDHDDVWHPTKLEHLLNAATPDCGVIYARWRQIDENGAGLDEARAERWRGARGAVFGWLFGWHCPLISMSVPIVRRGLLKQSGGFDPQCVPCDDWDLWLRLAPKTRFEFVDEVLVNYRCSAQQQSRDEAAALCGARRALGKHRAALMRRPLVLWWWLWLGAFRLSLPAYRAAKVARTPAQLGRALVRATRAHPLALLAPQWLAMLARRGLKKRN